MTIFDYVKRKLLAAPLAITLSYSALAVTHFLVASYLILVDSTSDASNYLALSITFAALICLIGAVSVLAAGRRLNLILILVQVVFSAVWLMLVWIPDVWSFYSGHDLSLLFSVFDKVGIVGNSATGDQFFHALSVLVFYLVAVPLMVQQWQPLGLRGIQVQPFFEHREVPALDLPKMSADARFVVKLLDRSIVETKARARWVLWLILLLLVAGVLVIAFAGQITNLDLVAGNVTTSLFSERSTLNNRQYDLDDFQQKLFDRQNARMTVLEAAKIDADIDTETGKISITSGSFADFQTRFQDDQGFRDAATATLTTMPAFGVFVRDDDNALKTAAGVSFTEEVALERTETNLRLFMQGIVSNLRNDNNVINRNEIQMMKNTTRLTEITILIDKETDQRIKVMTSPGERNSSFLIASAITRFGIVAIVVYIIQILVSLYRYNMRLASFYTSRLKAIVYGQNIDGSIEFFAKLFDTVEITFGKDINGPTQDVKEVIKAAIEQAGQALAKKAPGT